MKRILRVLLLLAAIPLSCGLLWFLYDVTIGEAQRAAWRAAAVQKAVDEGRLSPEEAKTITGYEYQPRPRQDDPSISD